MKFLVLSCNTGGGHNSAARAVKEKMCSLGHDCEIKDALAFGSKIFSSGVCNSYDKIVLHTPRAFGVGYRYSKSIVYKGGKRKSAVYAVNMTYSKKLYNFISQNNFDAVVCTHVFPAQAMTHIKHKYCLKVPIYVVATDYSFSPFYDELDVNRFFVSMKEVKHEYTERGIREEKIIPSGIPVSDRFTLPITKLEARRELCLDENAFLCVIMSGSMGFGNVYDLIDGILKKNLSNYQILVIAGNNTKLRDGILDKYVYRNNISAIGFTDKVHLYMKACDLIITKPGGLSSTEAMVSNVPLLLTSPIPGCETENYDTLTRLGLAYAGKSTERAVDIFEKVLLCPDSVLSVTENQRTHINRNSSQIICDSILYDIKNNCT